MSCLGRLFRKLFGKQQMRVLLLGLDNAGKTTILYKLTGKEEQTVPTIGFNVETIKFDPLELIVWDVAGQDKLRTFWRHYYRGTSGIIFVVDSNDRERLPLAKKELHALMQEEELDNAVVLILANKQDFDTAVRPEEFPQVLELTKLGDRPWHVQGTIASKKQGLLEGLQWLAKVMKPMGTKLEKKGAPSGTVSSAGLTAVGTTKSLRPVPAGLAAPPPATTATAASPAAPTPASAPAAIDVPAQPAAIAEAPQQVAAAQTDAAEAAAAAPVAADSKV